MISSKLTWQAPKGNDLTGQADTHGHTQTKSGMIIRDFNYHNFFREADLTGVNPACPMKSLLPLFHRGLNKNLN